MVRKTQATKSAVPSAPPSSAKKTTNAHFYVDASDPAAHVEHIVHVSCKSSLLTYDSAKTNNSIKKPITSSIFEALATYLPDEDRYAPVPMERAVVISSKVGRFMNQNPKAIYFNVSGLHENAIKQSNGHTGSPILARFPPETGDKSYGPVYDGTANIKDPLHLSKFGTVDADKIQEVQFVEDTLNPELSVAYVPLDHITIGTFKKNDEYKEFVTDAKRNVHGIDKSGNPIYGNFYVVPLQAFYAVAGAIRTQVMDSFRWTDLTKLTAEFSVEADVHNPVTDLSQTIYCEEDEEEKKKILKKCYSTDVTQHFVLFFPRCLKEGDPINLKYKDTPQGKAEAKNYGL